MSSGSCPSCGAPLEIKTRAATLLVCAYCNSTLVRHEQKLEDIGKMALLAEDGSPLQIGARGVYRGVKFEVIGRLQLEYSAGYWNEWYATFDDGRTGWVGEGQGQYAITFQAATPRNMPQFENLKIGDTLKVGVEHFRVTEKSRARCIASQGELPFHVNSGYDAPVADVSGSGARFGTIDYSEYPPLVFLGERVEFDALAFAGLREFEGWS
jgi:hypothetical protein